MEYAVCEANSAAALAKAVTAKLAEGWRLYGNLTVSNAGQGNWWYYQSVVRGGGADAEPDGVLSTGFLDRPGGVERGAGPEDPVADHQ